ncbi:MAG: phage holin family protein [Burkholderiaceae bacterium]
MEATRDPAAAAEGPAAQRPSFRGLADDIGAAFTARAHLVELEAKQAAWSAAYMLGFAVAAALLAVTAWLLLIGGIMTAAIRLGVPWWVATLVALVLHAGAAWLLVTRIRTLVGNLTFAATRRTLASRRPPGAEHGGIA